MRSAPRTKLQPIFEGEIPLRKVLLATATLVAFSSPALAADLPNVKGLPVFAPPPPVSDWSGFYGGGGIGGAFSQVDGSFVNPPPATWGINQASVIADDHVGVQQQFGSFVLGVEGSFADSLTNTNGTSGCNPAISCAAGTSLASRLEYMWTIGPRAGWAMGAWMPYITGGFADARFRNQVFSAAGTSVETGNTWNDGGYVGGGVEWNIFQNWYAGLEYRHYFLSGQSSVPTLQANGLPDAFDTWTIQPRIDTVSARLDYKFDWFAPPAPVVAKY
jgi:outer membrane immunogenic protein